MRYRKVTIIAALSLLLIVPAATAYITVHGVKWRVDALALKLTGQIDGLELGELAPMLVPGSGFWMEPIVATRNPYSAVTNPYTAPDNIQAGRRIFESGCAACHGPGGTGSSAPSLDRSYYTHGDSDWAIFKTIRDGIAGTAMPASDLDDMEIWSTLAYVQSLRHDDTAAEQPIQIEVTSVTNAMLEQGPATSDNWLGYSGSYNGQRHSSLDQINSENAGNVEVSWAFQFSGNEPMHETSPIVVDDIMFITESPNTVHALDATTGVPIWTYAHSIPDDVITCCGRVNRGVAIYQDTVYMGTLDSRLIALDAATGKPKWNIQLHDYSQGSSITPAPLVVEDKIIVGYGGGDFGLRGFLDAVNASDGSMAWRHYTVPAKNEPGNETWSGDSWQTGGGPTWLTGTYDAATRTLYWPIGNPSPDFQGDLRLGDNLYTNSILALDIDSGERKWHFQFTPHDEHDWDANQIPVLVDRQWRGQDRRLVMTANRNGFFYVLDRDSGEFLLAKAFARQNWALSIDDTGRPVLNPDTILSEKGNVTWPSPIGATNWQSPAYNPDTGLFYVAVLEMGRIVFKDAAPARLDAGEFFLGGWQEELPGNPDMDFAVRALDPETGDLVWEYRQPGRKTWWKTGGLVSTAGNILFGGDGTDIFVINATSGQELWRMNTGGLINASPVTYAVNGKQYFSVAAGRSIYTIALGE